MLSDEDREALAAKVQTQDKMIARYEALKEEAQQERDLLQRVLDASTSTNT